jgi:hypothetical protein
MVLVSSLSLSEFNSLTNYARKIRRPHHCNLRSSFSVLFQDIRHPLDTNIILIIRKLEIERQGIIAKRHVMVITSKSKKRIFLIWVVICQNRTDCVQSLFILVLPLRVLVMKRRRVGNRTVRICKINCANQTYLQAPCQMFSEWYQRYLLNALDNQFRPFFLICILKSKRVSCKLQQLVDISHTIDGKLIFHNILVPADESEFNRILFIAVAELSVRYFDVELFWELVTKQLAFVDFDALLSWTFPNFHPESGGKVAGEEVRLTWKVFDL